MGSTRGDDPYTGHRSAIRDVLEEPCGTTQGVPEKRTRKHKKGQSVNSAIKYSLFNA